MQRSMNDARFAPDIFHDVDLAALRPSVRRNVVAKHPECRPHALPRRNLDARFETSVSLRKKVLRFQTRRGVIARNSIRPSKCFFLRGDHEAAALDLRIHGTIGVSLELLIAPTAAAKIVSPFGSIGSGAIRAIKFVAPTEHKTCGRRNRRGKPPPPPPPA